MLRRAEHLRRLPARPPARRAARGSPRTDGRRPRGCARSARTRAARLAQPRDQVEHARLHRHVERARRLVEDDQPRLDRERTGDHDALALTARQLVREALGELRAEADLGQQAPTRRAKRGAATMWCARRASTTPTATRMRGSSAASPSWNTICTLLRPRFAQRPTAQRATSSPLGSSPDDRQEPHRRADRRLPRARLADQADAARAVRHLEVDVAADGVPP